MSKLQRYTMEVGYAGASMVKDNYGDWCDADEVDEELKKVGVSIKQVLDTLLSIGAIGSVEIKTPIKPGHGPCCTCQACGRPYEDCVCDDNAIIEALWKLEATGDE